jgi:two-component system, NarL family, nitrate/nitrite response regulator NarL
MFRLAAMPDPRPRVILGTAMAMRVLIVDDNVRFLEAARALMEREGVDVAGVALSSDEAIARVEQLGPDLALVDIDLGDDNGFDLARRLTELRGRNGLRVILMSAYPEADFRDLVQASPALGFLSKLELSAAAVRMLVGRS